MRPDTAGLWKTERIVIGDEDRISQHSCGHRLSVHYGASQLPGSRQQFLISLSAGRLRGCSAYFAICAASANRRHDADSQDRYCFDHVCPLH